jgi:hypothetical protein
LDEIISSTHILVDPSRTGPIAENVDSVSEEELALTRWVLDLRPSDGADVVLDTPNARIYKIIDRNELRGKAFELVGQFRWNSTFRDANQSYF